MLIAPIFHNSYLSPNQESLKKKSDASSSSAKLSEASSSSSTKYNNIFKSAFNRGITFLTKITNSSGSNTPTSSKAVESEGNQESSTPSDCSSPDSLKTELIFFKPITKEPKTASTTKPVLLRVPSIRSTASSTDRLISSPCPSPFFIPITPRRESAFSLVNVAEEETVGSKTPLIVKPKATKRKYVKVSPQKSPKRVKRDDKLVVKAKKAEEKKKSKGKTEVIVAVAVRKTRSMDKKENDDAPVPVKPIVKKRVSSQTKKSSPKINPTTETSVTRITRSRSIKH